MRHKTEKMKLSEQGVIREEALLAYIHNELTAEEKQELEKLLKEDPFAQDALEGLQQTNKSSTAAIVLGLNTRVRERVGLKEKKLIKLHWSNYAWAAVVFGMLIGIGFIMVTFMGKHNDQLAVNTKAKEESVTLMEQKPDNTPNLVSNNSAGTADSTSVVINETQNGLTTPTPIVTNVPATNGKADANALEKKPVTGENKNLAPQSVTINLQTGTATGGASVPPAYYNSTILADDKGTAPAKPLQNGNAGDVNGNLRGYGKADEQSGNRNDGVINTESKKAKSNAAGNAENFKSMDVDKNQLESNAPAATMNYRGAIIEKEAPDKVTVITMDDAMKSFNVGDYKKSSEQFGEILKQQPNNTDALFFGGISDYITGNTKKSEKNFDKLLKDGAKFGEGSKWYKANILLKKGKKEEAKKLLDELSTSGGSYKERAVKKKAEMNF